MPLSIGMLGNYGRLIDRHITSEKLRQVLYQYATYSGASPFKAPATMAVIPYVEMSFGAWYIPGGMYRLAEAMEAVARKLGVEIRTRTEVVRILVEDPSHRSHARKCVDNPRTRVRGYEKHPRATGVLTRDGETFLADCIIANSDV